MGSSVFCPTSTPASLGTEQAASLLGLKPNQFSRIAKKLKLEPERFYTNAFKQNCPLYSQSRILELVSHLEVVKARERVNGTPNLEAIGGDKIPVHQLVNGEKKYLGKIHPVEIAGRFDIVVSSGCKALTFVNPQEDGA